MARPDSVMIVGWGMLWRDSTVMIDSTMSLQYSSIE